MYVTPADVLIWYKNTFHQIYLGFHVKIQSVYHNRLDLHFANLPDTWACAPLCLRHWMMNSGCSCHCCLQGNIFVAIWMDHRKFSRKRRSISGFFLRGLCTIFNLITQYIHCDHFDILLNLRCTELDTILDLTRVLSLV